MPASPNLVARNGSSSAGRSPVNTKLAKLSAAGAAMVTERRAPDMRLEQQQRMALLLPGAHPLQVILRSTVSDGRRESRSTQDSRPEPTREIAAAECNGRIYRLRLLRICIDVTR